VATSEESVVDGKWYDAERNTEGLVKAVMATRDVHSLSGEDIWRLLQLTWITAHGSHPTDDHWQTLKVPALAHLFNRNACISRDLQSSLESLQLPQPVAQMAFKTTGIVNAYRAYRNSLKGWCLTNQKVTRVCRFL
jgi:hypothetical protein